MGSDFVSELAARPHWLALTRVLRLRFFALTGLDYRHMHRASDERRELEDRACGWRRVVTAEHKDKVNYGPLKEFWHTELVSTEDNQNKDMVRVFLGYDSELTRASVRPASAPCDHVHSACRCRRLSCVRVRSAGGLMIDGMSPDRYR